MYRRRQNSNYSISKWENRFKVNHVKLSIHILLKQNKVIQKIQILVFRIDRHLLRSLDLGEPRSGGSYKNLVETNRL